MTASSTTLANLVAGQSANSPSDDITEQQVIFDSIRIES